MRILLVQTGFLGDVILSTPVIAGLGKLFPEAELWVMTTPAAAVLLKRDPLVKGVIEFDKHKGDSGLSGIFKMARRLEGFSFDRAYSLHKSWRTAILLWLSKIPLRIGFKQAKLSFLYTSTVKRLKDGHDALRNLSLISAELKSSENAISDNLRLFAPEPQDLSSDVYGAVISNKPYTLIFPGSVWYTKRWNSDAYKEVAEYLINQGRKVLVGGAPNEKEVADKVASANEIVNLAGKTTLEEAMYLVKNAEILLCNDSMALHMASAFKTPVVSVFCATVPEMGFGPWGNRSIVLEKKGLECRPCGRHGGNKCPTGTEACINGVTTTQVVEALEKMLKERIN